MVSLLEEHIDLNEIIPESFQRAFYSRMGRNHIYHLDSLLWFVILKKFFGFSQNTQMINVLKCSQELRDLCGFEKVPDASQITRFLKNYCNHIENMFEHLVEISCSVNSFLEFAFLSYLFLGAVIDFQNSPEYHLLMIS